MQDLRYTFAPLGKAEAMELGNSKRPCSARFGLFEASLSTGELYKRGLLVRLENQPFQVLSVLLARPGEIVSREELRAKLWPDGTYVDFNEGVNTAVRKLRQALEDSADQPRFIETVPRRGYRFIAPVSTNGDSEEKIYVRAGDMQLGSSEQIGSSTTHIAHESRRFPRLVIIVGIVLLAGATTSFWVREVQQLSAPELKLRQLTTNPADDPVRSGAISADGKYLAYADLEGLHVRIIETGETHSLPQPDALRGRPVYWRVVGWFPNGASILANATLPPEYTQQYPSIWSVSLFGGQIRKVRDGAEAWSISPDGSTIAFSESPGHLDERSIWLMGSDGEQARKFVDVPDGNYVDRARWSGDGHRLAFVRSWVKAGKSEDIIETRDVSGGPATAILSLSGYRLKDYLWLPDGRIIYSSREAEGNGCNYWAVRVNSRTGKSTNTPRRLTNWAGFCVDIMSVTADAKRLAFVESAAQGSVYVANLDDEGGINNPARLAPSLGWNQPSAWAADSKSVIVRSNRDGRWRIYRQPLDGTPAQLLISEPEEAVQTRVLGPWAVYLVRPKDADGCATPISVMRVPVEGGSPEEVLKAPILDVRCGHSTCMAVQCTQDLKQFIFYSFDPIGGVGRELTRVDIDPPGHVNYSWSLSPEGTRIAVLKSLQPGIDVLPVYGGPGQKITARGWPTIDNVNWASDGNGFFVFSPSSRGSVLLHVDLEGNAHPIWEQLGGLQTSGIPSPDGRHLAILGWTINSNVWVIDNF